MIRCLIFIIAPEDAGATIRDFLRSRGFSQRMIVRLREGGSIQVDGIPAITPRRLSAGETLEIQLKEEESSEKIPPRPLPFPVVYEDADLLVINKPAGMPIHPSQGNHENTLANAAAWYFAEKKEPFVFRVINRLDRDTTGLLILARHSLSACMLSDMAARREIHREYLAAAAGMVPEALRIDAPIGRVPGSAIKRQVDFQEGDMAVTHCRRLLYRPDLDASLVQLKLETGRTHQIRVHMSHIGHPLYGDFLYNPDFAHLARRDSLLGTGEENPAAMCEENPAAMNRQALHSFRLCFRHPLTGQELSFTAPLPPDMQWILPEGMSFP